MHGSLFKPIKKLITLKLSVQNCTDTTMRMIDADALSYQFHFDVNNCFGILNNYKNWASEKHLDAIMQTYARTYTKIFSTCISKMASWMH